MKHNRDVLAAVVARERGRSVVRAVTITAGVAGLATAGVIAYRLPSPAHQKSAGGSGVTTPAASAQATTPTSVRWYGDDDERRPASVTGSVSRPGSASHATSGGS